MSDQIFLTGIAAFGYHGLFDHERQNGQDFSVDVALTVEDRKSTRLNSSHIQKSRMPSSA